MFKKITANLMVDNMDETLDLFQQVLGFDLVLGVPENSEQIVTARGGDKPLGFAIIRRDDVDLMLQSRQSLSKELPQFADRPLGASATLYIEVADVRKLYEEIKGKVTIIKDLHTTFYGMQEFYMRDGNGYVLTFAGKPEESAS